MKSFRPLVIPLVAAAALAAAGTALAADPPFTGPATKTITGTLIDTTGASIGAVQLSQDGNGVVQVTVSGNGLNPGEHGIHIHAAGKCEVPGFTTAAGHFNPDAHQHGLQNPAGPHNGDLTGLVVEANGTYTYKATTDRISLTGGANNIFDADGTALVIHADKDDQMTDPSGNSGARVACAVLAAPQPATPAPTATRPVPAPPNTGTGIQDSGSPAPVIALGFGLIAAALGLGATRVVRKR